MSQRTPESHKLTEEKLRKAVEAGGPLITIQQVDDFVCMIGDAGDLQELVDGLVQQRDELLAALKLYEQAFDEMFAQCCSNGMKDAWDKPISCTLLNEAHQAAGTAIAKHEVQS